MRHLVLVRHGETPWNAEGRFQGQTDIALNEAGRAQARGLRTRLEADPAHRALFDPARCAVVSSDLARAVETADIAFGVPGRAILREPRLREMRYGVFEGLTRAEILRDHGPTWQRWIASHDEHGLHYALEGGESRADVRARAREALVSWMDREPHEYVVVLTHGGVLRQLLGVCEGGGPSRDVFLGNVCVHGVAVPRPGQWAYRGAL